MNPSAISGKSSSKTNSPKMECHSTKSTVPFCVTLLISATLLITLPAPTECDTLTEIHHVATMAKDSVIKHLIFDNDDNDGNDSERVKTILINEKEWVMMLDEQLVPTSSWVPFANRLRFNASDECVSLVIVDSDDQGKDMTLDTFITLQDTIASLHSPVVLIYKGDRPSAQLSLLSHAANCIMIGTLRTDVENCIYECGIKSGSNIHDDGRTFAHFDQIRQRLVEKTSTMPKNQVRLFLPNFLVSATRQITSKNSGDQSSIHEAESRPAHKHDARGESGSSISPLHIKKAQIRRRIELLRLQRHHLKHYAKKYANLNLTTLPVRKKKVYCKWRKSCYETGQLPAQFRPLPLPEDKELENDIGKEISEHEIKILCHYRKSCYDKIDTELKQRKDSSGRHHHHHIFARRVVPHPSSKRKARTLLDIARKAVQQVHDQEKRAAQRPIPKKVIVDHKMNEIEQKNKQKLGCKFRKSCYETGVVPKIESWNLAFKRTMRRIADMVHIPDVELLHKPTSEELDAVIKKLYCKYRRSCYKSGRKPHIDNTDIFKYIHLFKRHEKHISLKQRCKFRKSCYQTGNLTLSQRDSIKVLETIEKPKKKPATTRDLKRHCRFRKSCYERFMKDMEALMEKVEQNILENDSVNEMWQVAYDETTEKRTVRTKKKTVKEGPVNGVKKSGMLQKRDRKELGEVKEKIRTKKIAPKQVERKSENVKKEEVEVPYYQKDKKDFESFETTPDMKARSEDETTNAKDGEWSVQDVAEKTKRSTEKQTSNNDVRAYKKNETLQDSKKKTKAPKTESKLQNKAPDITKSGLKKTKYKNGEPDVHDSKITKSKSMRGPINLLKDKQHKKGLGFAREARLSRECKIVKRRRLEELRQQRKHKKKRTRKVPIFHAIPTSKRKLYCQYRKSCYETGKRVDFSHPKQQEQLKSIDESEEEEISEHEIKTLCKFRKSCYDLIGAEIENRRRQLSSGPVIGRRRGIPAPAPNEDGVRRFREIARKALEHVREQERRGAERKIPIQVIIDKKMNEMDEDRKKRLACKYRKSCYETGIRPVIPTWDNMLEKISVYLNNLLIAPDIDIELLHMPNVDEFNATQPQLFCKYRKSCYETGLKPVIPHSDIFKYTHLFQRQQAHISMEQRCKWRKSCYESGNLTIQPRHMILVDEDKTVQTKPLPTTLQQLKIYCHFRKSCYARYAQEFRQFDFEHEPSLVNIVGPQSKALQDDIYNGTVKAKLMRKTETLQETRDMKESEDKKVPKVKTEALQSKIEGKTKQSVNEQQPEEQKKKKGDKQRKTEKSIQNVEKIKEEKVEKQKQRSSFEKSKRFLKELVENELKESEEGKPSEMKEMEKLKKARTETLLFPAPLEEQHRTINVAHKMDGEVDTLAEKLHCKYRISCYETLKLPDLSKNFHIHHIVKRDERYVPIEHKCKYRKSCYETGIAPEISFESSLLKRLHSLLSNLHQEKKEIRMKQKIEERKLACKYRKSCYLNSNYTDEKLTMKTIPLSTKRKQETILTMCKDGTPCDAIQTKLGLAIKQEMSKAKKLEIPPITLRNQGTESKEKSTTRTKDEDASDKTDEKSRLKKQKRLEKIQSEDSAYSEVENEFMQIAESSTTKNRTERIQKMSNAAKLKCKYRITCYEGVPLHRIVLKVVKPTMKDFRRPNGEPCSKYYISCRLQMGLPIKERAPIGPNGKRLCRKKPKEPTSSNYSTLIT
ncbi:hypothetical protein AB6A40_004194 [Gnathostoma spinigerum]|uniref:Uncharacterized protein n=1 Tax=Gnathostoma spinigerum TaxID=75299 RepID=A0ABD6ECW7_9BILA